MTSPIKTFLLKDHAPTQYFLYSVPVVNVFVRTFQSYHSLDDAFNLDDTVKNDFEIKKTNFKKYMHTAIGMQLAIAISALALYILLPPATIALLHLNAVFSISVALSVSNLLCDSIWRSKIFAPTIAGSVNIRG